METADTPELWAGGEVGEEEGGERPSWVLGCISTSWAEKHPLPHQGPDTYTNLKGVGDSPVQTGGG